MQLTGTVLHCLYNWWLEISNLCYLRVWREEPIEAPHMTCNNTPSHFRHQSSAISCCQIFALLHFHDRREIWEQVSMKTAAACYVLVNIQYLQTGPNNCLLYCCPTSGWIKIGSSLATVDNDDKYAAWWAMKRIFLVELELSQDNLSE